MKLYSSGDQSQRCHNCNVVIGKKAWKCPSCGKLQQNVSNIVRMVMFTLIVIVAAVIIASQ